MIRSQTLISLRKLLLLSLTLAAGVQLIVITYNNLTGFYSLSGPADFMIRFLSGTLMSLLAIFLIAWADLRIIHHLNRTFPWESRLISRISFQFFLTIALALLASSMITWVSHLLNTYPEGLATVMVDNFLVSAVLNLILMAILEAWIFFMEGSESRKRTEYLEKELSQIRFEVLKNQINPHFMFNSLNVLSGLIDKDTEKAHQFIDEFSHIYRYVLETIEKPVVTVREELEFARSYIFLQQIRYGEHLGLQIDLSSDVLDTWLPPLSLQVVLENAIKHNRVSDQRPLHIDIVHDDGHLVVTNNLQLKIASGRSTGVGQENLIRRYRMISRKVPSFRMAARHYQVRLPLMYE
jgi:sensor histidine kinase YesM